MRLLGCFSKSKIILDTPSLPQIPPPSSQTTQPFVPASIAELHPEYAHSEPYCFQPRTDSARQLEHRALASKGLQLDRAKTLKSQGHVVVRGPAHSVKQEDNKNPVKPGDVVLTVESPTTEDVSFVESDDDKHGDENVDTANHIEKPKKARKSGKIKSRKSGLSNRSGKGGSGPLSLCRSPSSKRAKSEARTLPPPKQGRTYSSSLEGSMGKLADSDGGRATPPELLAPIRVPRLSHLAEQGIRGGSPAVSNDSWTGGGGESARFEDVEEDLSSGMVKWAAVGKEKVVHQVDGGGSASGAGLRAKRKSKPFLHQFDLEGSAPPAAPDSSYESLKLETVGGELLETVSDTKLSRQISAGVMSDDIQVVNTDDLFRISSPVVRKMSGQRELHEGVMYLPNASTAGKAPQGIMRRASTTTKRKTVSFHDESPVIIEPNLRAPSRSLPREAMLTKSSSETSEFKDALDRPSDDFTTFGKGVRDSILINTTAGKARRALLEADDNSKADDSDASEIFDSIHNGAPNVVMESAGITSSLAPRPVSMSMPKTMDIPRSRMQRELSDSSGTDDSFRIRSSRRMSRVSIRDKEAIREASKRQSKAVAQAMSEQIRGVPRSAMLAFEENEVMISEDDDGLEDDNSDFSYRRRSRQSKTIRAPVFTPGVVPLPPPPPPFLPEVQRVRSVRRPPPPPVSPLSSAHK